MADEELEKTESLSEDFADVTWLAFVKDDQSITNLTHVAANLHETDIVINKGDVSNCIELMETDNSADHLIVDITDREKPIDDLIALGDLCNEGTRLIVVGNQDSVKLYHAIIDLGADEYILKPFDEKTITKIILRSGRALHLDSSEAEDNLPLKPLVAVIGTAGGLGSSTLAINLAWILSQELKVKTCLVDFDLYFGTCSFAFNKTSNQGLVQAIENSDRLDDIYLKRVMLDIANNFSVLAADQSLNERIVISEQDLDSITTILQQKYTMTIVDIPHGIDFGNIPILNYATQILLVSEFSVIGIRDTARLLQLIISNAPATKVNIAILQNRFTKATDISRKQFEESINRKIDYIIPNNQSLVTTAFNQGEPIAKTHPTNKLTNVFRTIAQDLQQKKANIPTQTWWSKLIKGK